MRARTSESPNQDVTCRLIVWDRTLAAADATTIAPRMTNPASSQTRDSTGLTPTTGWSNIERTDTRSARMNPMAVQRNTTAAATLYQVRADGSISWLGSSTPFGFSADRTRPGNHASICANTACCSSGRPASVDEKTVKPMVRAANSEKIAV